MTTRAGVLHPPVKVMAMGDSRAGIRPQLPMRGECLGSIIIETPVRAPQRSTVSLAV
jgi:hypothetical protein